MSKELNRRDFIKGTTAGIIGAASVGMLSVSSAFGAEEGEHSESSSDVEFQMDAQKAEAEWTFQIPPEPIPESDIAETREAEIIVVGAGTSGL